MIGRPDADALEHRHRITTQTINAEIAERAENTFLCVFSVFCVVGVSDVMRAMIPSDADEHAAAVHLDEDDGPQRNVREGIAE